MEVTQAGHCPGVAGKSWPGVRRLLVVAAWMCLVASGVFADEPGRDGAELEFFEREVRPVLAERCYSCHSRAVKDPKGGLRADSLAELLKGGDTGPAVVPGDIKKSLLIDAINYGELYQMPPKSRLSAKEVAALTRWVEIGAPWPKEDVAAPLDDGPMRTPSANEAWLWNSPRSTPLPAITNRDWPQGPADYFLLASQEAEQLQPAPPATRIALLRRLYFDFTGLPPTPETVTRFLADNSPDAVDREIDLLLASPQYGERWARHWMDLVRYAETCGHEFDYPIRFAYRYRDYLIRALNEDLPYDQFVREHVAGDLLPTPRLHPLEGYNESILGTGFWFLGEAIHAPVDVRGDQTNRLDNQLDVFSKTFLGMTVACARCHDHKFDPISQQDYYALAGFLVSSRREEALLDPHGIIGGTARQQAATLQTADEAFGQLLAANERTSSGQFARGLLATRDVLIGGSGDSEALSRIATQQNLLPEDLSRWLQSLDREVAKPWSHPLSTWKALCLPNRPWEQAVQEVKVGLEQELARWDERNKSDVIFASFEGDAPSGWLTYGDAYPTPTLARLRWDPLGTEPRLLLPGTSHSGLLGARFEGVLRSPSFTISHRNIFYRLAGRNTEVRLIVDGYTMIEFQQLLFGGLKFPINTEGQLVWHRQAGDLGKYLGHRAYIEVIDRGDGFALLDEVRFSDQDTPPADPPSAVALDALTKESATPDRLAAALGAAWDAAWQRFAERQMTRDDAEWINWGLKFGLAFEKPANRQAIAEWCATQHAQWEQAASGLPEPMRGVAMVDGPGENERFLIRGNPRTPGAETPRRFLERLAQPLPETFDGSGRLYLANRLTDPANPFTWRVMVNRFWHHLFGRGLVPSVDNLGVLGEPTAHPELLDFLAIEFQRDGGSWKRSLRRLALTRAYQMSSVADSQSDERDPTNRLWHRRHVRRLEGEAIRDAMLAASERLDLTMYGPSVPVHITAFMQGRGRPGSSGPLDGAGRRSLYIETRRNFLSPMMLAFDTPIPFNTVGRRNSSNVPAQALILLNDPFVMDQASRWARETLRATDASVPQRVTDLYMKAFSRTPTMAEIDDALSFLEQQGREYKVPPADVWHNHQVWTDLCHVLLNAKEYIFLD